MDILELKQKRMRFFDRTEEIASLKEILELSKSNAQFTVVTGRRRINTFLCTFNITFNTI